MLYITCIVGVQAQLFGKSLVSIENGIYVQLQISIHSYIENHTNNKLIAIEVGRETSL